MDDYYDGLLPDEDEPQDTTEEVEDYYAAVSNPWFREKGASAVEYGLLVAAIAAIIAATAFALGNVVSHVFEKTCVSVAKGDGQDLANCAIATAIRQQP